MRGQDSRSGSLFSHMDLEQRVRPDHPLRTIRSLANEALASLDGRFGEIDSEIGRPSIPLEPPAGGRNAEVDFHGQRLSNDTHRSTTHPEAKLYRKGRGREAKLSFMGHLLMENRNGLIVDGCVTEANGQAERIAALAMIEKQADRPSRITLGADKGHDAEDFVNELRSMNATPHSARNTPGRRSALDRRTTRHPGSGVSQRIRKRIEEGFGWGKAFGLLRRIRLRGCERVDMAFAFSAAACNLIRLPKLLGKSEVA